MRTRHSFLQSELTQVIILSCLSVELVLLTTIPQLHLNVVTGVVKKKGRQCHEKVVAAPQSFREVSPEASQDSDRRKLLASGLEAFAHAGSYQVCSTTV
jgi:hypothetical protein